MQVTVRIHYVRIRIRHLLHTYDIRIQYITNIIIGKPFAAN